jgi:hypothetical protein
MIKEQTKICSCYLNTGQCNNVSKCSKDAIVESLKKEYDKRSEIGIKKYNTTLKQNNTDDFLQHLKEELMDATLYIQKLQSQNNK